MPLIRAYIGVPLEVLVHKPKRGDAGHNHEHPGHDPADLEQHICSFIYYQEVRASETYIMSWIT